MLEDCSVAIKKAREVWKPISSHIEAVPPDWSLAPAGCALKRCAGWLWSQRCHWLVTGCQNLTARQLMAYLGLVPSEQTSRNMRRQGGITKSGMGGAANAVEAGCRYRFPARIRRGQRCDRRFWPSRSATPEWKAQERLCRRYRKLARLGKSATRHHDRCRPRGVGDGPGDRQKYTLPVLDASPLKARSRRGSDQRNMISRRFMIAAAPPFATARSRATHFCARKLNRRTRGWRRQAKRVSRRINFFKSLRANRIQTVEAQSDPMSGTL